MKAPAEQAGAHFLFALYPDCIDHALISSLETMDGDRRRLSGNSPRLRLGVGQRKFPLRWIICQAGAPGL